MNNIFYLIKVFYHSIYLIFIFRYFPENKKYNGSKLRKILQKLGPTYIKLGQTLSSRPDLIGQEIAEELAILQDKLPAFSFQKVKNIIESELEDSLDNLFQIFEPEAYAAASIAQVHQAVTKQGQKVAVKVIRPNIQILFIRDIKFLSGLAKILEYFFAKTRRLKLKEVVVFFSETVKLELDLRFEAAAASELKDNIETVSHFYVPNIYWLLTSKNILTSEWIDGVSFNQKDKLLSENYDIKEICKNLAIGFFNQAYKDGFFHADMHAGNVKILPNNKIALLDFGIMGRLDKETRLYLAEILHSFLKRDYQRVAELHFKAGHISGDKSVKLFAQACRALGERVVNFPSDRISVGKLLAQLFQITADFNMTTQIDLILFQKTTIMIEGLGRQLDPEINLWQLAKPWIEKWAMANISPEAKTYNYLKSLIMNLADKPDKKYMIIQKPSEKLPYPWMYSINFSLATGFIIYYLAKKGFL